MSTVRDLARSLGRELAFVRRLRVLPPRVAVFQWRARRLALRLGDAFSPTSSTEPEKLATLLSVAGDRARVVELGTATGWTAISLLLADRQRTVVSYDIVQLPEVELYLKLVSPAVRSRLGLIEAPGHRGPERVGLVDLLYIDSSHERGETIRELQVWRPSLRDGAIVVLDDYTHPDYPGVHEAVRELGLEGEEHEGMFVHRVGGPPA